MNRQLIAGLLLAGSLALAPAAKALPLIDIGIGAGPLTMEDDSSSATAATVSVNVNLPLPLLGVEGQITETISDGRFRESGLETDYSGGQVGAFATLTSPTPVIKVKGKLGLMRSDFDFNGFGSVTSTDLAFGAAAIIGDWQIEWTRTMLDDGDFEQDVDFLSISYVF